MSRKVNKKLLNQQILNSPAVKKMVAEILNKEVEQYKADLINEFSNHPVTQELDGGENASNISGTLGGYGNLFSFIGFNRGSNPTEPILSLLKKIRLNKRGKFVNGSYQFQINIPSESELSNSSRLPWEGGRSWLFDIEKTISGIGSYLFARTQSSRSGTGIQIKNTGFSRSFRSVKYFGTMYKNFLKKINNI